MVFIQVRLAPMFVILYFSQFHYFRHWVYLFLFKYYEVSFVFHVIIALSNQVLYEMYLYLLLGFWAPFTSTGIFFRSWLNPDSNTY